MSIGHIMDELDKRVKDKKMAFNFTPYLQVHEDYLKNKAKNDYIEFKSKYFLFSLDNNFEKYSICFKHSALDSLLNNSNLSKYKNEIKNIIKTFNIIDELLHTRVVYGLNIRSILRNELTPFIILFKKVLNNFLFICKYEDMNIKNETKEIINFFKDEFYLDYNITDELETKCKLVYCSAIYKGIFLFKQQELDKKEYIDFYENVKKNFEIYLVNDNSQEFKLAKKETEIDDDFEIDDIDIKLDKLLEKHTIKKDFFRKYYQEQINYINSWDFISEPYISRSSLLTENNTLKKSLKTNELAHSFNNGKYTRYKYENIE